MKKKAAAFSHRWCVSKERECICRLGCVATCPAEKMKIETIRSTMNTHHVLRRITAQYTTLKEDFGSLGSYHSSNSLFLVVDTWEVNSKTSHGTR